VEIQAVHGNGAGERERDFELIGGHSALDLVNTLDWRFRDSGAEELLTDYSDLVRFTRQCGLITAAESRRLLRDVPENRGIKVTTAVRELREAAAQHLYAALKGERVPSASLKTLKVRFSDAREQQRLVWTETKLAWEFSLAGSHPELPLWLLSIETLELMTSDAMLRLRECGNPECRWLFLDTSKNHTRRWCDMKICGNRMKARRFKAQHGRP
jgi:predicted RNA-binding Zn ribbon-like protein